MRSLRYYRREQQQVPASQCPSTSHKPCSSSYGVDQQLFATNQLLELVVQHLQAQSEELRQIRRSAAACENKLSFMAKCMQQLVVLASFIAQYTCTIATAAAELMGSIAAAQHSAKLQLTISSGRLVMLVLLIILSLYTGFRAIWSSCAARSTPPVWLLLKLRTAVAAAVAPFAQHWGQQHQPNSFTALVTRWSSNPRLAWCLLRATGCFMLGEVALVAWTVHAYSRRSAAAAAATGSKLAASTAFLQGLPDLDPFLAMVVAVLPVRQDNISSAGAVLQAALYEGLYGAVAVYLVSGRWRTWAVLWGMWLACCYFACTWQAGKQNQPKHRGVAEKLLVPGGLQQMPWQPGTVSREGLLMKEKPAQTSALQQQQQPSNRGVLDSIRWSVLQMRLLLAAAQLLLPVVIAVVTVWC